MLLNHQLLSQFLVLIAHWRKKDVIGLTCNAYHYMIKHKINHRMVNPYPKHSTKFKTMPHPNGAKLHTHYELNDTIYISLHDQTHK